MDISHMNETSNNTADNNMTADNNTGLGAYIAYTVPAVKELVFKYLKNNEAELMDLLDKNLTKAQMKAFDKLDETAQKHVKDSLVRNVLITAWDEKDDELASLVKSKVKSALDEGKTL